MRHLNDAPRRAALVALVALVALAALLRLAHYLAVRDAPFVAQLAMDSAEYDRWAREIAAGDWSGGAPFFQAPLYPYLLAVVYRIAGRSLDVVYLLQIALALAGIYWAAKATERILGPRHALAAAALAAVYQPAVFHEVQLTKEAIALPLAALLIERLTKATQRPTASAPRRTLESGAVPRGWAGNERDDRAARERLDERATTRAWLAAGGVLGLLALLRENALLLFPFLAPLVLANRTPKQIAARRLAAFAVGLALPLLPVAARNAALGGGFLPTTFQGGVNFWIGNNPEADGTYRPLVPGKQIPRLERAEAERLAEQASGRELKGGEVSRYWLARALAWARDEPLAFARLQARKLALYLAPYEWPDAVDYAWVKTISPPLALPGLEWGGLVALAAAGVAFAGGRRRALGPALLFELGWLASTVAFFLFARYRLPAAAGLFVLASIPLVAAVDLWRGGRRRAALAAAAGLVAALVAPHAVAPSPRADLVEYNLGRLAEERRDPAAARRHYAEALAADPDFFLAAMNLGTLAARQGDLAEGLRYLEEAVRLEPRSDDAWANLGAARLAAGDLDAAREALRQALALHPAHAAATANLERLERRAEAAPAD